MADGVIIVKDLIKDKELPVVDGRVTLEMMPGVNYVFELKK